MPLLNVLEIAQGRVHSHEKPIGQQLSPLDNGHSLLCIATEIDRTGAEFESELPARSIDLCRMT